LALINARKELDVSAGSALASPNGFAEPEPLPKDSKALPQECRSDRADIALDEIESTATRAFVADLDLIGFLAHARIVAGGPGG
jgi:hypothetical protein